MLWKDISTLNPNKCAYLVTFLESDTGHRRTSPKARLKGGEPITLYKSHVSPPIWRCGTQVHTLQRYRNIPPLLRGTCPHVVGLALGKREKVPIPGRAHASPQLVTRGTVKGWAALIPLIQDHKRISPKASLKGEPIILYKSHIMPRSSSPIPCKGTVIESLVSPPQNPWLLTL